MNNLQMKHLSALGSSNSGRASARHGRAQTILLLAIFFFLGIAVSAFWFYQAAKPQPQAGGSEISAPAVQISEPTREALRRLPGPVEIHFYSLLDPASVPPSLTAFSGRVDQLLGAYERAGGGLVKVTRSTDPATAGNAEADGLDAFNRGLGQPCYLGIAVVLKGHRETLPRLSTEWEQAIESDITRAISRALEASGPTAAPAMPSRVYTNAPQEVRALIPNLDAVSLDAGKRIIQEAAIKEFAAATKEMQTQIKEAEQQLRQVQTSGTQADKDAAVKQLQQMQRDQAQKLKDIAARARAQVEAFQQMKSATR